MTKEQRAAKWDAEFIPCKNHPERRCQRARYIGRDRVCYTCFSRRPYRQTDKCKAAIKKYHQSTKGKTVHKRYEQTEKGKASKWRKNHSYKGLVAKAWYLEKKLHGGNSYTL